MPEVSYAESARIYEKSLTESIMSWETLESWMFPLVTGHSMIKRVLTANGKHRLILCNVVHPAQQSHLLIFQIDRRVFPQYTINRDVMISRDVKSSGESRRDLI